MEIWIAARSSIQWISSLIDNQEDLFFAEGIHRMDSHAINEESLASIIKQIKKMIARLH